MRAFDRALYTAIGLGVVVPLIVAFAIAPWWVFGVIGAVAGLVIAYFIGYIVADELGVTR